MLWTRSILLKGPTAEKASRKRKNGISPETAPKHVKLKPSYIDAQGSVLDDTATVEMLSKKNRVIKGREGKKPNRTDFFP